MITSRGKAGRMISKRFGVKWAAVRGESKAATITDARAAVAWYWYWSLRMTQAEIGSFLRRTPSGVHYLLTHFRDRLTDPTFKTTVEPFLP